MGETRAEVSRGDARPARRRHRDHHHHAVPAALAAAPSGRALGQAGGVRRAAAEATEIGFAGVISGPLVRSSYRAGRLYRQALATRDATRPRASSARRSSERDGDRAAVEVLSGQPQGCRGAGQGDREGRQAGREGPQEGQHRPGRHGSDAADRPGVPADPRVRQGAAASCCSAAFLLPVALAVVFGLLADHMFNAGASSGWARRAAADDRAGPPGQGGDLQAVRRPGRLRRGGAADAAEAVGLHPGDRGEPEPGRGAPHPRPGRAGADRRGRARPGQGAAGQRGARSTSGSRTGSR